jgi:NTP pyrophosphatase (non-canonical NTP hydrolase)
MASSTAIYDEKYKVFYPALGLAGEAGEVANKVKKLMRDSKEYDIAGEIGDVLWYVAALCSDLGLDMDTVATKNLNKLNSRKNRGVLGGSGDNR